MARKRLTEASIRTLKPAPAGKRLDVMDEVEPGLGVRVTDKGAASFVFLSRYPGSPNPTRRSLGDFGTVPMKATDQPIMSLADAREKARGWRNLIARGVDPRDQEQERRTADQKRRDLTLGAVVEDYLKRHVRGQRKAAQVEREIRGNLIPAWGKKPVTAITRADVVELVEAIADRTRAAAGEEAATSYQAHNVFGHIRTFFNWALMRGSYGLETSPCDRIDVAKLVGNRKPRLRVLNDDELFAFWRAAGRLGYPFGPWFKLIALLGDRRGDIAEARRSEYHPEFWRLVRDRKPGEAIDWATVPVAWKLWIIPAERFKSDAPHRVPLCDDVCEILAALPQMKGPFLFSTTFGDRPISGFSKAKARLDRRMERTLKAMARKRGEHAPRTVKLEPFVNHDIRRTVRTRLSALKIPYEIAEAVIGHAKKGLARVYDQHAYEEEIRDALERWATLLRGIVERTPPNVIDLQTRRA
jgi:integrase